MSMGTKENKSDEPEFTAGYEAAFGLVEGLLALMDTKKVTQAELATRTKKTASAVSKWFSPGRNLTVFTAAMIAKALGGKLRFEVVDVEGAKEQAPEQEAESDALKLDTPGLIHTLRLLKNSAIADYTEFVRSRMAPNTEIVNHMGFAIGLMAEAGEYGDLVKKERLHARPNTDIHRQKKKDEIGDVFWYLFAACIVEGFDPLDVLAGNVEKLTDRANDAAYAAKNPNVPTNTKPAVCPICHGNARPGDGTCPCVMVSKPKDRDRREQQMAANDVAYAAKNPNVPTNIAFKTIAPGDPIPAPVKGINVVRVKEPETKARLGDAECHACDVEPLKLGAGFVECRICGTVRPLLEKHSDCKAPEPKTGSGCG
jgi:NTP pyrophosphatase (non-canonical NTP hydrolase)/transcriptional regulator with XRE-family HTH domain